jgi:hypothetical protein
LTVGSTIGASSGADQNEPDRTPSELLSSLPERVLFRAYGLDPDDLEAELLNR